MERGGRKMRETGDKAKRKKGVEGERKKKRSGRRLPPVLPLLDSGTVFVFLESQINAHHTPVI